MTKKWRNKVGKTVGTREEVAIEIIRIYESG